METGDYDPPLAPGLVMAQSWQATVILGTVTLFLGLIVSFHPAGSLNVVAILLGLLMILSGIFHLVRMFGPGEGHRIWLGIAGLLFIVIGVVLIRHLDLTIALVGLFVGITWIVQGVTAILGGATGPAREGRGWWIAFGVISLIAGIVVTAAPVTSVTVLALLLGIWFIVIGLFEIIGGLMLRRAAHAGEEPLAGSSGSAMSTS